MCVSLSLRDLGPLGKGQDSSINRLVRTTCVSRSVRLVEPNGKKVPLRFGAFPLELSLAHLKAVPQAPHQSPLVGVGDMRVHPLLIQTRPGDSKEKWGQLWAHLLFPLQRQQLPGAVCYI